MGVLKDTGNRGVNDPETRAGTDSPSQGGVIHATVPLHPCRCGTMSASVMNGQDLDVLVANTAIEFLVLDS